MDSSHHEDELRVQARAGVREMAERVGRGVRATVPPVARHFLGTQRPAVVGLADRRAGMGLTPDGEGGIR